jgi:serine/threonine-protein kinase
MPESGPPVPEQFSHYRVVRRLGAGGMGQVLEAIDVRDSSRVALKLMWPHLANDPSFRERFEREAHVGALLRSPFTVHLLDYGFASGSYFLVMEYIEGETLEARLRHEGTLPAPEALRIAIQVARALEEAEAREVVHRDLKPENVMLTTDGRVKVTDFGIARDAGSGSLTATQLFLGTPQYGAPEQFANAGDVTPAADQYALGVMLFRMLTGELPFTGSPLELANQHINAPVPMHRLGQLPTEVQGVVLSCLAKDPRARYPNVPSLLRALRLAEDVVTGRRGSSPGETVMVPPGQQPTLPPIGSGAQSFPPQSIPQAHWQTQPPVTPTPTPGWSATPPPARESHRSLLFAVIGVAVVLAVAIALAFALKGGGDESQAGGLGTASATAIRTGAPSPSASASTTVTTTVLPVSATPAPPTITPTKPPLPTPVLAVPTMPVPDDSPAREIVDTVNRNSAVYIQAMNTLDESLLPTVFIGNALTKYQQEVRDARATNKRSTSSLVSISLTSISTSGSTAHVTTREVWTYTTGGTCGKYTYNESYDLQLGAGGWRISTNDDTPIGGAANC